MSCQHTKLAGKCRAKTLASPVAKEQKPCLAASPLDSVVEVCIFPITSTTRQLEKSANAFPHSISDK